MKKIIESLFNLFFPAPEDSKVREKCSGGKWQLFLMFIGLMFLFVFLIENNIL